MDAVSGAHRQKKLRMYEVTIRRTVEFTRTVKLSARNVDEAIDIAATNASEDFTHETWGEGEVIGEGGKAKVLK